MSLADRVLDIVATVIRSRRNVLQIPIKRGTKFERWLVIEIAYALKASGFENIQLEAQILGGEESIYSSLLRGRAGALWKLRPAVGADHID